MIDAAQRPTPVSIPTEGAEFLQDGAGAAQHLLQLVNPASRGGKIEGQLLVPVEQSLQFPHPVLLQVAANPFDFWPLIERGLSEWSRTSDALLGGAPFRGAPDLFCRGLGGGAFDLFLGEVQEVGGQGVGDPVDHPLLVEGDGQGVKVDVGVSGQFGEERRGQRAAHLFDVVSVFHGYLQGHLLWVAPEWRGRGLVGQYFDAALDVARRHGLKGFMFLSTLPFWGRRAPRYGFSCRFKVKQRGGPDVLGWFRET